MPTHRRRYQVSFMTSALTFVHKLKHRFLSDTPEFRMTYKADKLTKAVPFRKKCMHWAATFISYPIHILYDLIADNNAVLTLFQPH